MNSQKIPSPKTVAIGALAWTTALAMLATTAALAATSTAEVAGLGLIGGLSLTGGLVFAKYAFVEIGRTEFKSRGDDAVVPFGDMRNTERSRRAA